MERALADAMRLWVALVVTVCTTYAVLVPSLLTTADASGTVGLAVLTLALAALALVGVRSTALATSTERAGPATRDEAPPVLPGRVTDPVHHPLRPRAPGPA